MTLNGRESNGRGFLKSSIWIVSCCGWLAIGVRCSLLAEVGASGMTLWLCIVQAMGPVGGRAEEELLLLPHMRV